MATTSTYLSLEVDTGIPLRNTNGELDNIENFIIAPVGADTITAGVRNIVSHDDDGGSTIFIFDTTDMTHGKEYSFTILDNKLILPVDPGPVYLVGFVENFFAVSELPVVQNVVPLGEQDMEILFNKDMAYLDLDNPANYVFDKGLMVLSVRIVSPRVVRLTTSRQTPSELYSLTIL